MKVVAAAEPADHDAALEHHAQQETRHLRQTRHKLTVDDFEQLDIIGRGAFGEVRLCRRVGTEDIFAMKKLRKAEMVAKGQVQHIRTGSTALHRPPLPSTTFGRCSTCAQSSR